MWVDRNIKDIPQGSGARSRAETDGSVGTRRGGGTEGVQHTQQRKGRDEEGTCLASGTTARLKALVFPR